MLAMLTGVPTAFPAFKRLDIVGSAGGAPVDLVFGWRRMTT